MRVRSCMRLFSPLVGLIGLSVVAIGVTHTQTLNTDLSKDLNRSAFSTRSILADLANSGKQNAPTDVAPLSGSGTLISQPGAFQYDPENRQSTSAHKVTEEIRAAQELENRQKAEVAAHPFWYARFWTHSPVAILYLLGGDHQALETPPTEFEKLGATNSQGTNYNNEAELKKFERSVSFGNSNPADGR
jgi:hypothetical protein